jgi:putative N6-adenine-specific DNA methylase
VSGDECIFAACAPGLEEILAAELGALGLAARPVPGGAEASGRDAVALACLAARVADAVALRLFDGPARGVEGALAGARHIHGPAAPLAVRREGGRATLSLDAAGSALYKRGWRARTGAAPLRETLAAGMLLAAGYDGSEPFLDPMCGSGTLALEAAALGARRAPGRARAFAFERWPGHDAAATAALRAGLAARERPAPAPIHASDRNAGAVRLAQKNAADGGFTPWIRFERREAASAVLPPGQGLIGVNPPYGVRLEEDVSTCWRALAELLERARAAGWRAVVLAPDRGLERLLPGAPSRTLRVRNGGLACLLLLYGS